MTTPPDWNALYSVSQLPPLWDTGRPQPAFVRLTDRGLLSGRVLDAGCGTGEHTLLAAARDADTLAEYSRLMISRIGLRGNHR